MKSQLLPPTLCLMLAILFYFSPTLSSAKNLKLETKTEINANVVSVLDNTFSENPTIPNTQNKVSENVLITDSKSEIINELSSYEEISNDSAEIISIENSNYKNSGDTAMFGKGMFYGVTIMVFLLNLICFFLFEEKIFLYFSLTITALVATFMSIDSLFPLIGINGIENMEAMHSTLFFLATTAGAFFASKYLTLEESYPKLKWIAASLLGFSLLMVISSWTSDTAFFSSVVNVTSFSVLALYFSAGITLFEKKNYVKLYVIALSIPLLFSLDFFVFNKVGVNFLSTENSHLKAAALFEMFLMTFAIVYRMRALKEEQANRQTEMRIFLKRQEVLNRTNTEKLIEDIYLENVIMQYDLDGLEIKLLQYISEGKDNAKIARKLKTTEDEIELLTKELYNKLEIGEQVKEDHQMLETQADYIYN